VLHRSEFITERRVPLGEIGHPSKPVTWVHIRVTALSPRMPNRSPSFLSHPGSLNRQHPPCVFSRFKSPPKSSHRHKDRVIANPLMTIGQMTFSGEISGSPSQENMVRPACRSLCPSETAATLEEMRPARCSDNSPIPSRAHHQARLQRGIPKQSCSNCGNAGRLL